MSGALPQGWTTAPLGEIAEINPPHAKGLDDSMPVSFVRMAAVSESKPEFQFLEERRLGEVRKGFTHFADGDVLFAKITPCMENGKGAVATGLRNGLGYGTTELLVVRPRGGVDPHYVYRFLAQPSVRREAKENFTGTAGQARVPTAFIDQLNIPLAPLSEQRRIVTKLETLLGKADACQEGLEKIRILLKRCRQSVLAAACSGRLTADWRDEATEETLAVAEPANVRAAVPVEEIADTPDCWRWLPLHALCDPTRAICYGVIKLGAQDPAGVPCLRTSDVKALRIDTAGVKRISQEISNEYRRTLLRGGEVLVNVRGTLGGVAVVPRKLREWNISREVALVPIARVSPKFIAFWIASLRCQHWLTGVAKGVAYTGINIEDLRLLPVATPSLAEQHEIVRRVEALFALTDKIEARLTKAQAHVDKLTPSLLAKAFCGELVPTEAELARREKRDYESASALLERIHSEHGRTARLAEPRRRTQRAGRSDGAASVSRPERSNRAGSAHRQLRTTRRRRL